MKHLLPYVAEIATKSDEERINYTKSRFWIPYPKAQQYLDIFHDTLTTPRGDRMPCYLLTGEPNNGKTHILRQFESQFLPRHISGIGTRLDVLYIQAPAKADESRLYNKLLKTLNVAFNLSDKVSKKYFQVLEALAAIDLKILVIDEIHNIVSSTYSKQRDFLMVLKTLTNELNMSIICAGTIEAHRVMANDRQLTSRFEPLPLKNWRTDTKEKATEYLDLLMTFERLLPLKEPSNIIKMGAKIHHMGEGLIGEYSKILKYATIHAIKNGQEKITEDILDKIEFTRPSLRERTNFN